MSEDKIGARPKRHHWWPQLQSGHWTDPEGLIHVVKADGTFFKTSPLNIGVEGDLYTRYQFTGEKDLTIERWFSEKIETPFVEALERLASLEGVTTSPLPAKLPEKERDLRELGFVVPRVVEKLQLSSRHRLAIDSYLAALLVRNPRYLAKLVAFHDQHNTPLPLGIGRAKGVKTVALENMLSVFELYRDQISKAHLGLLLIKGDKEFLFADAGITAQEPWHPGPIPFDIHAPLTPKMAIEVLPVPDPSPRSCFIMRVNGQGVARMNRIILEDAERFVFCRGAPPTEFIKKHFGQPAPKSIGRGWRNGALETRFDRSREGLGTVT